MSELSQWLWLWHDNSTIKLMVPYGHETRLTRVRDRKSWFTEHWCAKLSLMTWQLSADLVQNFSVALLMVHGCKSLRFLRHHVLHHPAHAQWTLAVETEVTGLRSTNRTRAIDAAHRTWSWLARTCVFVYAVSNLIHPLHRSLSFTQLLLLKHRSGHFLLHMLVTLRNAQLVVVVVTPILS